MMQETMTREQLVKIPGNWECTEHLRAIYTAKIGVRATSVIELSDHAYACFDSNPAQPNSKYILI